MGVPDFRERDKLKNRAETGNAQFSKALRVNFPNLFLNGKNMFRITIPTQNTPIQFKNGARDLEKTMFLNKFVTIPSTLNISLPLFLS